MTRNQMLFIIVPVVFLLFLFFTRDRAEEARKANAGHPTDLVGRIMEHNAQVGMFPGLGGDTPPDVPPNYANPDGATVASPYSPPAERRAMKNRSRPDEYYPPRPPRAPGEPQTQNMIIPKGIEPVFLGNGRPIAFIGEKVYTVDETGLAGPLPDGYYPILDGRVVMHVRNGRKLIN